MAESDLSNEVSATTVLPSPSNISTSSINPSSVDITWQNNDNSSDGGIDVERTEGSGISGFDGFEDNGLADWTNYTASVVSDRTFSGSNSVYSNDNSTVRMMERTLSSGGFQPEYIEWHLQETSSGSYGSGVRLFDASGNEVVAAMTDNPQLDVWDANGFTQDLYSGNGYDRWIRFRIEFDWSSGEYDLIWEDLQANDLRTFANRPLAQTTNIEQFEIWNYNGGSWGTNGGNFESWFDNISWSSGSNWTDVATGLSPSTTSYTDNSVSEVTTYQYRIERNTDHASSTSSSSSDVKTPYPIKVNGSFVYELTANGNDVTGIKVNGSQIL